MSVGLRVVPPYVLKNRTANDIMADVCLALTPPMVAAVWFFGWDAVWRLLIAAGTSLCAGMFSSRRVPDVAALVTGLILCLSCPVGIPLWLLILLCFFAVCVVRDGFGGIGSNLFNPAMAARAVLIVVFPLYTTGYTLADSVSSATPLSNIGGESLVALLAGRVSGSMGETSALMILLGLCWLLFRRVISWHIPLLSLLGFSTVILIVGQPLLPHLLSGSILFAAVYIFTDYTSKPITWVGECAFAVLVGAVTALLRLYGRYPEGVCFAVLLMNLASPLLEYVTTKRRVSV